jgi:PadR family transcriptional regulator PadR
VDHAIRQVEDGTSLIAIGRPESVMRRSTFSCFLDEVRVERLPSWPSEGRLSSMANPKQQRAGLLQGTLDMLILRTLLYGPSHGHQIGKHIQRTTNDFLQMQHGSLYPALHRLEKRGWVVSKWETAPDRNREFKYYRLTDKGRKQLVVEESQWKQMAEAVARIMWPAAEES